MVTTAIHGARGYLGRELVRLLTAHPHVDDIVAVSTTETGLYEHAVPAFRGSGVHFHAPDDQAVLEADVAFLAVPGGTAGALADQHIVAGADAVIDLSRDHRLVALDGSPDWKYGLADVWPVPVGTKRIANPGCYPTASLLALAPALQAGLIGPGPIIIDGKSGVSGAGVALREDLHFAEMNESVRAYKVLGHDHTHEIAAAAGLLNGAKHPVRFTPHLVPQTRGLLVTAYAPCTADAVDVKAAYEQAYADSRFVRFGSEADTGRTRGSNVAEVAVDVDPDTGLLVARGAIDNMCKGGAGTAIQNMNATLGLEAWTALPTIGGNI